MLIDLIYYSYTVVNNLEVSRKLKSRYMQRKISFGVYSIHSIAQNKKIRKIYWSGLCTDILYLWKTIEFLVIFLLLDFIPNGSSNVSII